ncbi:hypothetical protein K7432_011760 [Basidiobolus ranarum]|uniref:Uncharacterized protein n=1 Tax=Basidiobolus ranarum TaxID=34480 RepID=A0ABR2WLX2_9FUNG
MSATLSNGVYRIELPHDQLVTQPEGSETGPAYLLPPTGNAGEQEFEISENSDGTVNIRNIKSGHYLSSENEVNATIILETQPKSWTLTPGTEPSTYVIQLPGEPVDGEILAVDMSLLRIFPPRLALRPFNERDGQQQFKFNPLQ